jgi:transcription antitermination factor NusG
MLSRTSAAHQDVISYRSGPGWHVVYTAPRAEKEVQYGLWDIGFDVYLPMERAARLVRGHRVPTTSPLLPRYLFVAFDPHSDEWGPIMEVDGVADLLANNGVPSRLPMAWMVELMKMESCGVFDRTCREPNGFAIGEVVRMSEGPFAGMSATIQAFAAKMKSATAKKRVKVLMDFLGRQVTMDVDVCELEKV